MALLVFIFICISVAIGVCASGGGREEWVGGLGRSEVGWQLKVPFYIYLYIFIFQPSCLEGD